jgi:hypothetical protein
MKWENAALEILRSEFPNKAFRVTDAFRVLNKKKQYSKGTLYRVLHDLSKRGLVEKLGRGIYRVRIHKIIEVEDRITLSDTVSVELASDSLIKAKELLGNKGIEFMVTGFSLLYRHTHHLPKRLIHLIYVIKGAGEPAVTSLREVGFRALLNPSSKEMSLALNSFAERDIFVFREFSELSGNVDGNACLERALVDLYFEATRKRIPFSSEETGRIFLNVFRNEHVDFSRLFFFANRRGVKEELRIVAKILEPDIPVKAGRESKRLKEFLNGMREGILR